MGVRSSSRFDGSRAATKLRAYVCAMSDDSYGPDTAGQEILPLPSSSDQTASGVPHHITQLARRPQHGPPAAATTAAAAATAPLSLAPAGL